MLPVKRHLQSLLKRVGLYHRVQSSLLYDLYWACADKRILARRAAEVEFYARVLHPVRPGDLIFDVGANHGQKTDVFLRLGARVVAIDPDEANQAALRDKFHRLRLVRKPVVVVGQAVSERVARETMWIDAPGSAKNTLSQKWVQTLQTDGERFGARLDFKRQREVQTTTLDELIRVHGTPVYIKIDVEGYEPMVLRGLTQPVPLVSYEVNLPEFKAEGAECARWLARLAPEGRFNCMVECAQGLTEPRWCDLDGLLGILERSPEKSVEIFFRSAPEPEGRL